MSARLQELPLFPLHSVLLPYQALPLHIIEERYREMVRDCLDEDRPFGVVLIREGSEVGDPGAVPYMVGTTARIVSHKTLPDGQMHVLTMGEGRFRIRRLDYSRPYPVGYVEPIVEMDVAESPNTSRLVNRAKDAFRMHLDALFGRQGVELTVRFTDDPMALSFAMAGCVQLSLMEKQRLLEITDTSERIREIIPLLERQALEAVGNGQRSLLEVYAQFYSRN
ncbi:MAG: LON peptidase substrate-binding domain-containing protein [Armatimonadetes bacterium]|nr:LON peptidase substrate-binding domain-containing protein [Armatimonadota bacterium]